MPENSSSSAAAAAPASAALSTGLGRLPRGLPGEHALWRTALDRLARRLRCGRLTLVGADGRERIYGGTEPGPEAVVRLTTPVAARKLLFGGAVGFAEAYVDGLWETPDLDAVLRLALANDDSISIARSGSVVARLKRARRHRRNANTKAGSRRNIAYHYDLGNAFYGAWLDPSMTYSSALWEHPDQSLEEAQATKYRRLCDSLALKPGDHVLEIGCGWGGFAEVAARDYGCRVTAITLSREQLAYARRRIQAAGLADRVAFRFQDYRETTGQFDAVASIEMFEAVGEAHWPVFFETVKDRLKPGGRAGLQVITIEAKRFEDYRSSADFIQTHVFPGGMLPTDAHLTDGFASVGMTVGAPLSFGRDYARTLDLWRQAFVASWLTIVAAQPGFDDRFRRLWLYYLAYCKVGFSYGSIDVIQIRADRPA